VAVGFGGGGGDLFDLTGIGDDEFADQRQQMVVDVPGVGGGLDHDGVARQQMSFSPSRPTLDRHLARLEHDALGVVDAADIKVVLVQVNGNEAGVGHTWLLVYEHSDLLAS
jgi:hypothetical protein